MSNRLIHETSPYLLQHAGNPVDWYPWSDEAFQAAKTLNRPIFLSVGYSSCHWCHVMAHESFENSRIARILNDNFVSIKVDREERPDVDSVYMSATQMLTGQGGWPMSVFLTPDLKPFFSGTYFPPEDRPPMPGFPRVLQAVLEAFTNRRDEVDRTSTEVQQALERQFEWDLPKALLNQATLDQATEKLVHQVDQSHGGFGGAPKFPPSMTLEFLMRRAFTSTDAALRQPIELTLTKMAAGGIHDQIGGGFHRYSVDAGWLVPHFEKMLYDNALLGRLYTFAYQAFGKASYRQVAERLFTYVLREMCSPEGGFYSSQDADSEGEEGKFYLWEKAEIEAVLDPETATVVEQYYGVTPGGNFEGKSILNVPLAPSEVATSLGIGVEELETTIALARERLYETRSTRVWPGRDDKILTSWNSLMLRALAEAAAVFKDYELTAAAVANATFLKQSLWQDGRLLHSYRDGVASIDGFLDDYAALAAALISLYQLTFDADWFNWALELVDEMIARFWDENHGSFFDAVGGETTLIARPRDAFDSATPSGNALAAETLLRIGLFTADESHRQRAVRVLETFGTLAVEHPSGFGHLLSAIDLSLAPARELALIGDLDDPTMRQMLDVVRGAYRPNLVVAQAEPDDLVAVDAVPLLQERWAVDGSTTAYVCRDHVCDLPLTDSAELAVALSAGG